MAKTSKPTTEQPESFEAAMAELDAIVTRMEDGALPLADALAAYQRGAALLVYCQQTLKDAQQQVRILEDGMVKEFAAAPNDNA